MGSVHTVQSGVVEIIKPLLKDRCCSNSREALSFYTGNCSQREWV